LLLVLLGLVALVLAVFGAVVGGLALVLSALAAVIVRRTRRALLILLAVGLVVVVALVLVTHVDADECAAGECVEVGGWGFDPFILFFAIVNFLAWCLGLFLGRLLRPFIRRTRASEN
jgi:hypothetical protein